MVSKRELIVDSFAGGGGVSLGIARALGREPDIAINHDRNALAMHAVNHPGTLHVEEDVWKARLRELVAGRRVGLLWASPDCKHFSRAKGSMAVEKSIRSLAWVVVRWASQIKPRVIVLENVREFQDWGPCVPRWVCRCGWQGTEGQTLLQRSRRRCTRCESLKIVATDCHVPCPDRKGMTFRLFVNRLRGLGYHVEWRNLNAADYGAPTHRRRLFLIARRDGKPIVWPEPTHIDPGQLDSTPLFDRLRPWRTAAECIDWSIPCKSIFDRPKPLAEKTMRRIAIGIKRYVMDAAEPFIVRCDHGGSNFRGQAIDEPVSTVTAKHGFGVCVPTLIQCGYGERKGQAPRVPGLEKPLGTVETSGGKHALVSAFIAKHFGGVVGCSIEKPLPTTLTSGTQNQLAIANLVKFNYDESGVKVLDPLPTNTTGNHVGLVYSFLIRYFGTAIGQSVTEPMYTITGHDRFGLVLVQVAGTPYFIADIGMRMLTPRELARAQGFPDSYQLTGTKSNQVARIGNSVCPQVAEAIVHVNYTSLASARDSRKAGAL